MYICNYNIYRFVSSNEPGIKPEAGDVMQHVATESIIQLVNYEISPKSLLELFPLPDIRAMYECIFLFLSLSPLSDSFCNA